MCQMGHTSRCSRFPISCLESRCRTGYNLKTSKNRQVLLITCWRGLAILPTTLAEFYSPFTESKAQRCTILVEREGRRRRVFALCRRLTGDVKNGREWPRQRRRPKQNEGWREELREFPNFFVASFWIEGFFPLQLCRRRRHYCFQRAPRTPNTRISDISGRLIS